MITSREYRQFARECVKWADEAATNETKKITARSRLRLDFRRAGH
jgi:hypothetical protein